jgi:hypothetical protein
MLQSSRTAIVNTSTTYNVSRPSDRDCELVQGFDANDEDVPNQTQPIESSSSSSQLSDSEIDSARVNYLVMNYMSWRAHARGSAFWAFFVAVQPIDQPVKKHCDGDCVCCVQHYTT